MHGSFVAGRADGVELAIGGRVSVANISDVEFADSDAVLQRFPRGCLRLGTAIFGVVEHAPSGSHRGMTMGPKHPRRSPRHPCRQ